MYSHFWQKFVDFRIFRVKNNIISRTQSPKIAKIWEHQEVGGGRQLRNDALIHRKCHTKYLRKTVEKTIGKVVKFWMISLASMLLHGNHLLRFLKIKNLLHTGGYILFVDFFIFCEHVNIYFIGINYISNMQKLHIVKISIHVNFLSIPIIIKCI